MPGHLPPFFHLKGWSPWPASPFLNQVRTKPEKNR